jgi:DNA-binding response OmpR family regulator
MVREKEIIIIVAPRQSLSQELDRVLIDAGFETSVAYDEISAIELLHNSKASIVLFDRKMVKFELLLRDTLRNNIVLIAFQRQGLSCPDDECAEDLNLGVDASLCDQTSRQLVARVRAILRRSEWSSTRTEKQLYRFGNICMDLERHEVRIDGQKVNLTYKEFQILKRFLHEPRRVFTRRELLDEIWGEGYALEEHTLNVHIHALRQKIEKNPHRPQYIQTVRRVGYKFTD